MRILSAISIVLALFDTGIALAFPDAFNWIMAAFCWFCAAIPASLWWVSR